jgi:acyl-CoA dehydrogenase
MDFSFTDEQQELAALARRILEDKVTETVLRAADATDGPRFDPPTWAALAEANLLGIGLPTELGGSGYGIVEQGKVLEEVGRTVAPVPVAATTVLGALPIARFGSDALRQRWVPAAADGSAVLSAAWSEPANRFPDRPATIATLDDGVWRLDGVKTFVVAGTIAEAFVVSATASDGPGLFVVERGTPGLTIEPQVVTDRDTYARLSLADVVVSADARLTADDGTDVVAWAFERATVAQCAQMLGVLSKALEMTAQYATQRVQFERPIATFQAVGHRLADCYIAIEGLRLTLYQAMWHLEAGLPASMEVEVAKFWAAEAGHNVAHAVVHVHGGTGIDEDYPLHRYYVAAKSLEFALGGATDQLLRIGVAFASSHS